MKYALVFFMLACLTSSLAVINGHGWHLLHWLSIDFILLWIGYAFVGSQVLGKLADGRRSLICLVIFAPYLLYTHMIWCLAVWVGNERPVDQVSDRLYIGRRLHTTKSLPSWVNYVDLTTEMQDPRSVRQTSGYVCFPILDGAVPDIRQLYEFIERIKPGVTYVHCAQGHGRTGLFALSYLIHHGKIKSMEEGLERLTTIRSKLRLNRMQKKFVQQYFSYCSEMQKCC